MTKLSNEEKITAAYQKAVEQFVSLAKEEAAARLIDLEIVETRIYKGYKYELINHCNGEEIKRKTLEIEYDRSGINYHIFLKRNPINIASKVKKYKTVKGFWNRALNTDNQLDLNKCGTVIDVLLK